MKKEFHKPEVKLLSMEGAQIICASDSPTPGPIPPSPSGAKANGMEGYSLGSTGSWY